MKASLRNVVALSLILGQTTLPALAGNSATGNDAAWDESGFDLTQQEWSDDWGDSGWEQPDEEQAASLNWSGFGEILVGTRVQDSPAIDSDFTAGEAMIRLNADSYFGDWFFSGQGDLFADGVTDRYSLSVRELSLSGSLSDHMDVRVGRFVSTWGTGDLLFLNDLFAKDWEAFFAGREMNYLKRASNSIKFGFFLESFNIDVVWTPVFSPDRIIDGERFSYFNPMAGQIVAADPRLISAKPDKTLANGEFAVRAYGRVADYDLAAYAWRGFFKQPLGLDTSKSLPNFPRLNGIGGSVQGNLYKGIFNLEASWYDSADDRDGDDPSVPNSQLRLLLGYQQELVKNLTFSTQAYAEWTMQHDELIANSPRPGFETEELRQALSVRLTHQAMMNNLTSSVMLFVSPTDKDYFLLPSMAYRVNDRLSGEIGGRLFGGRQTHTFYGQHKTNSNLYGRVRMRF
ncbi:MAG: hypothetical protein CSA52_03315 [Gammaproteobacteria bacterium]|nr:MAG: hypothetical protein CSB48_04045 [Pseudomonadota bacterium]PIE38223.1 MAG: hypothetical protein CSA52_03315 [Gammaproteobacteria bacterium]